VENAPLDNQPHSRAPRPDVIDHRADPQAWADALGISREAVDLWLAADPIDLHTDTLLWWRLIRWNPKRRHRPWFRGSNSPFLNQVDFPRAWEARYAGICWDLPTNPWRLGRGGRKRALHANLAATERIIRQSDDLLHLCTNYDDFVEAKRRDRVASWVTLQGANALGADLDLAASLPDLVLRITMVHLTPSEVGMPSSLPRYEDRRLSDLGKAMCEVLQERKILVDLAHVNPRGFWDIMEATRADIPVAVTHTGCRGVHQHWRNVDDDQLRAIAERGGVVGTMYQPAFLNPHWKRCPLATVVDHIAHVVKVAGEDCAALGSDFDGLILLPDELRDITESPKLVQLMLERGWSADRIHKILGGNFLRLLKELRGYSPQ